MQNLSLGSLKFLFFLSFQSFQLVEFFFRVYNTYFNGIFCISWQNTAVASTLKPQHHPQKKNDSVPDGNLFFVRSRVFFVLKVCYTTLWPNVLHFCRIFAGKG